MGGLVHWYEWERGIVRHMKGPVQHKSWNLCEGKKNISRKFPLKTQNTWHPHPSQFRCSDVILSYFISLKITIKNLFAFCISFIFSFFPSLTTTRSLLSRSTKSQGKISRGTRNSTYYLKFSSPGGRHESFFFAFLCLAWWVFNHWK